MDSFTLLPKEITIEILLFCSLRSLGRLKQCSVELNEAINRELFLTWIEVRDRKPRRRDSLAEGDIRHLARVADGIKRTAIYRMLYGCDDFTEDNICSTPTVIKSRWNMYLTPHGKLRSNGTYYSMETKIVDFICDSERDVTALDENGDLWKMNLQTSESATKVDTGVAEISNGGAVMISKKNGEIYLHQDHLKRIFNRDRFLQISSIYTGGPLITFVKDGEVMFMEGSLSNSGVSGKVPGVTDATLASIFHEELCIYTTNDGGIFIITFNGNNESTISKVGTSFVEMPEINSRVYQVGTVKDIVQMEEYILILPPFNGKTHSMMMRTAGGEVYTLSEKEYQPKRIENISNAVWLDNKNKRIIALK